MKKICVMSAVLLLTAAVLGAPGLTGGRGMFRVDQAQTEYRFALNLHFDGYANYDGDITTWNPGYLHSILTYSFTDWFEVFSGPNFRYLKPHADSSVDFGLWKLETGLKFSYPLSPQLSAGAMGFFHYPLMEVEGVTRGSWLGGKGLFTLDLSPSAPLVASLNVGYLVNNDEPDEDLILVGGDLEFPILGLFTPFAQLVSYEEKVDAETDPGKRLIVTPGLRISLPIGLNLEAGWNFFLSKKEPRDTTVPYWTGTFGLSYSVPRPKRIPVGIVAGKITDAETGAPLPVAVRISGAGFEPITVRAIGGEYQVEEIPPGKVEVAAEKEGYTSAKKIVLVEDQKTSRVDLALEPLKGTVKGKVVDKATGAPLPATISFPGTDIPEVKTDPGTGEYSVDLDAGSYQLTASAPEYAELTTRISISSGQVTPRNLELVKIGIAIVIPGVNFETAKSTIRPESYPILDEAAKILIENPGIRVEVQGHTDSQGSDAYNLRLSQARAEAVRNYLIEKHRVDPDRLTARGYGERRPIADNATEEGRAENRRVEFKILTK